VEKPKVLRIGLLLVFLSGGIIHAQVPTGTISATAKHSSGAVQSKTPSPALLILDRGNVAIGGSDQASLAIVDPLTNKIVARVPVGEEAHAVAVSADGKLAFVANFGGHTPGHTISVIDLAAQKELRRFDLGPLIRPSGLAVAEGKVYFTAQNNKLIGRYDPASDKVDWLLGTGQDMTHTIVLTKDSKTIFTANMQSDTVTAFEPLAPRYRLDPPDWKTTVIPVANGPEGIDVSPDDKEVWTATRTDGSVSIIDVATKKVTQTFNVQTKKAEVLRFSPDGKMVLVSDMQGGELVIIDAVARKVIKRIKLGTKVQSIMVAPDSSRAYVGVNGESNVAIVDLKTLELTGRIPIGDKLSHVVEAPGFPNGTGAADMVWVGTR